MSDGKLKRFDCTRRKLMIGAGASIATLSLPGLAQAGTDANSDLHVKVADHVKRLTEGRTVTLRLLLPEGSGGNLAPVVTAFTQMTGVGIELSEAAVDEVNTVLTLEALSDQQGFDVALPATFGLPDLVSSGAIQPLSEYAEKYEPAGFRDDILFATGDSFDGDLYGFQTDGDAYVMFYHRDMLENAEAAAKYADRFGVALDMPLTWEELDRQMSFFHDPQNGRHGGLLFRTPGYLAWEWWVRFHAKGIWPFTHDMTPLVAGEAGIAALEEMIRASAHLCSDAAHLGLFGNWERYARGDVYCNIGWGGTQKYLNAPGSAMRGRMRYGPTPGGVMGDEILSAPYFNWGWDYVVASKTPEPEIAYLFALFASSPHMSTLAVRQTDGFFDPFRPEHYADAGIVTAYTTEFLDVHQASLRAAIPDLYLKDQSEYFRVLGEWLGRALQGDVPPQRALERVAFRWEQITNGVGRALQAERWARLRAKYPPQMQRLLQEIA